MNGNGSSVERERLLERWARYVVAAAQSGNLTGKVCQIERVYTIAGPRAGAIELYCGLKAGAMLRALRGSDGATLRQFVPWDFAGEPQVFMAGRYVRCEAGWPDRYAEREIRLEDLGEHPHSGWQWIAGKSEGGATIVPGLSDRTPHFLFAGETGSGKSVALRAAVLQLLRDPENKIVLLDGKYGESLRQVERLAGVVGPCAVERAEMHAALGWAAAEMRQRYEAGYSKGRVIVVFDEFQEAAEDEVVVGLLRKLCAQGRAAAVHCLLATQHPTIEAFGDASIRRNLVGKVALRVGDADASRVAVGGASPRAYNGAPGVWHRVQMAYVDDRELDAAERGQWRFQRWPRYNPEAVGQELPEVGWSYTGDELAVSIVAAAQEEGRPSMVKRLEEAELGRPGAERAMRLLGLGRDANGWLNQNGYAVCLSGDAGAPEDSVRIVPNVW